MGSSMAGLALRILFVLVLAATAACRGGSPGGPQADRGGELVASIRSEPVSYNRYLDATAAADVVALLTHATLVRVDRVTDNVEPALAERWEESPDGATVTFRLRRDVTFSDGAPLTAEDVLFSFEAVYAEESRLGPGLLVAGKPLAASALDAHTVAVRFPSRFAPGVRMLAGLPILPRHKLEAAFREGRFSEVWTAGRPLSEIAGLGPFVLAEHVAGQRLVFTRNPRYWGTDEEGAPLPRLDRIRVEIVPEQNAEALRLESGDTDLMSSGELLPDVYARFKRLADQDRVRLVDAGVGLDPNLLWFNLAPAAGADSRPWLRRREFRQALSHAADRQAIANAVHLGSAVPIGGPVTPRNATWYSSDVPVHPHDPEKARQLLASVGLADRNGDGMLEDARGQAARFSVLVQQGVTVRERTLSVLQDQFRRAGIGLDIVPVDNQGLFSRWSQGDYDSVFHSLQASATDPGMNLDFWLSSGSFHVWHPRQEAPATAWERRIDELMARQVATTDEGERQRLFAEVQRVFAEQLPALYFVAPHVTLALSPRVAHAAPVPQIPQVLWKPETLAVTAGTRGR